ncbi:MAG: sigma-70 family RNA polymerase sigma factor [Spirosomaceae bacterium]|jgi:RNA polymerase sigma factor (sigma-70 family)|nr:sigma-70 family RNA polymerase sigma factor [Spirosomataceae bacterium]
MFLKNNKYSEEELIELLRRQDRKAFNYLYDNYSDAIYGIVLKVVHTEEVAQDLMQDIFVKIWKNITQYDGSKGRLFTWMLNVARNSAIDYLRIKRPEIQDIDTAVYLVEGGQKAHDDWTTPELQEIVSRLRPEQQKLIEMVYWGGYTHEETAKQLDMPLGTVKTRVRGALQDLRKIFGA